LRQEEIVELFVIQYLATATKRCSSALPLLPRGHDGAAAAIEDGDRGESDATRTKAGTPTPTTSAPPKTTFLIVMNRLDRAAVESPSLEPEGSIRLRPGAV
jgi:hypothetical protein